MRKIITIAHECGAGGQEVGRKVAQALNIEYYDRDIILRTAMKSNYLSAEQVREWDERVPHDIGLGQSLFNFYSHPLGDELWLALIRAIREMAEHESCVIVGRNADYILKEFDHVMTVFVHADEAWRIARMQRLEGIEDIDKVRSQVRAVDKARRSYCRYYTKRPYGQADNYDMAFDTARLGIDKVVRLITEAAEDL